MKEAHTTEIIYFYNNYYFCNRDKQEFFLYKSTESKVIKLSEIEFNIIKLLSEIKESLYELV